MNLTYDRIVSPVENGDFELSNESLTTIQWNHVEDADYFIINVSPSIEAESTFMTTNTSIPLPLLYNQEYTVRVMASNCAGNSTPMEMNITIGKK